MGLPLHHLYHLISYVFTKTIEFFSRTVEVYLHASFGKRYLAGRVGLIGIAVQASLVLFLGVLLKAPFDLASRLLNYEPNTEQIAAIVASTSPTELDMRDHARSAVDNLQRVDLVDELAARAAYTTSVVYESAFAAVTLPFSLFVAGYGYLLWFHHRASRDGNEVNDWSGHSNVGSWVPWLGRNLLTGWVEPLLVLTLAFLAWGQIPESKLHIPLTFDADPVLGHFLLVAGLCLFGKEQLRQRSDQQREEDRDSVQRAAGRLPEAIATGNPMADQGWPVITINHDRIDVPPLVDIFVHVEELLGYPLERPDSFLANHSSEPDVLLPESVEAQQPVESESVAHGSVERFGDQAPDHAARTASAASSAVPSERDATRERKAIVHCKKCGHRMALKTRPTKPVKLTCTRCQAQSVLRPKPQPS